MTANTGFIDLVRQAAELLRERPLAMHCEAALAEDVVQNCQSPLFSLVVLGIASAGRKLIDDVLGITYPIRGAIRVFTYGAQPKATLHPLNGESVTLALDKVSAHPAASSADLMCCIEVEIDNPLLKTGVEIVDISGSENDVSAPSRKTYLLRANGFLFVTSATQVFPLADRTQYAALLGRRDARQALFAVTDMHLIEEEDADELHAWVRKLLKPYFTGEQAFFDAGTHRCHVFFINPRSEQSVSVFRHSLQTFLTSPECRLASASAASAQTLIYLVGCAIDSLTARRETLHLRLERLRDEERDLSDTARQKARQEVDFEDRLERLRERCRFRIDEYLVRKIDLMYTHWTADAPQFLHIGSLNISSIAGASVSSRTRERLRNALCFRLRAYLQSHFNEWVRATQSVLSAEVAQMDAAIQGPLVFPDATLDSLSRAFGDNVQTTFDPKAVDELLRKRFREWLGVEEGGRMRLLARGTLFAAISFAEPPVLRLGSLVALAVFEAFEAARYQQNVKRALLNHLRENFFRVARTELTNPELLETSFADLDGFMAILGGAQNLLAARLCGQLPEPISSKLKAAEYGADDRIEFLSALNQVLEKAVLYTPELDAVVRLQSHTQYALKHSVDNASANRLLLADAFPEYVNPKVKDILYTAIEEQLLNATLEVHKTLRSETQDLLDNAAERLRSAALEVCAAQTEIADLAASEESLYKLLATVSAAVYSTPVSREEVAELFPLKAALYREAR